MEGDKKRWEHFIPQPHLNCWGQVPDRCPQTQFCPQCPGARALQPHLAATHTSAAPDFLGLWQGHAGRIPGHLQLHFQTCIHWQGEHNWAPAVLRPLFWPSAWLQLQKKPQNYQFTSQNLDLQSIPHLLLCLQTWKCKGWSWQHSFCHGKS